METALTDPRKTEVNEDFSVSTALFANRLETRLFSRMTDHEIPAELVKLITETVNARTMLDRKFLATDTGYRYPDNDDDYDPYEYDDDDYEDTSSDPETYVSGIYVDTYGFADAEDIHDAMVKAVREFVSTRKRTVSYV